MLLLIQVDLTEDSRCSLDAFRNMADVNNEQTCEDSVSSVILKLVNGCTKCIPKKRPTVNKVKCNYLTVQ